MRKTWLVVTGILFVLGVWFTIHAIYWIVIGFSPPEGPGFVIGSFIPCMIFYFLAYATWKKAKQP